MLSLCRLSGLLNHLIHIYSLELSLLRLCHELADVYNTQRLLLGNNGGQRWLCSFRFNTILLFDIFLEFAMKKTIYIKFSVLIHVLPSFLVEIDKFSCV